VSGGEHLGWRYAAPAIALLRSASYPLVATTHRLVPQHQLLVQDEARHRQEEPLNLADEGGVLLPKPPWTIMPGAFAWMARLAASKANQEEDGSCTLRFAS